LDHTAALLDAGVPVLVEKPLSDELSRFVALESLFSRHHERIEIAYNLRYLSSSQRMKQLIVQEEVGRIHSIRIDVGQYLPDWRPQSDYRRNVSANKALGGGVLLELSHEFDYLTWIFGRFDKVYCITSNSGQLEIDVEDRADIMLSRADGVVAQLHMDFLQRKPTRQCKVMGECGTLLWNLSTNSIVLETASGEQTLFAEPTVDRNDMYVEQLRGFIEVAAGRSAPRITLDDGLVVMGLIEAMRHSSSTGFPTFIKAH
jgi:predicted dehydrogenase